jgi:hypothetical protein
MHRGTPGPGIVREPGLHDIGHGVRPVMETPEWSTGEQQASTQQKPRPECWSGLLCLPLLRQFEPFEPIRAMGIPQVMQQRLR